MTYHESFLRKRGPIRLELASLQSFLTQLGAAHRKVPAILVAGTNGKGSVAATLSALLTATGLKTGLFTSPHLIAYNERFRLNDVDIDDTSLLDLIEQMIQAEAQFGLTLSFFEMAAAMAFQWFQHEQVDVAVLEVGLGGRLDATNLAENKLGVVLTPIDLDHQQFLGNSLAAIATEKAAIISPKGWVVSAKQPAEVEQVIRKAAIQHGALLQVCGRDFPDTVGDEHRSPLRGEFQARNLSVALATYRLLMKTQFEGHTPLSGFSLEKALQKVRWPGRMQLIQENPWLMVDGAHNPLGVRALFAGLAQNPTPKNLVAVVVIKRDKDAQGILGAIPRHLTQLVFPTFSGSVFEGDGEFFDPQALAALALSVGFKPEQIQIQVSWQEALGALESQAGAILFGSLYFIGDVLATLNHVKT